jgi:zinc finger protein 830
MQGGQNGVDAELDDFLSSIAGDVAAPTPAATSGPEQKKVYRPSQPETQISYEAAPIRNLPASTATAADGTAPTAEDEEEEETEADRRKRMQREEKEEIMDRLFEEQRAQ